MKKRGLTLALWAGTCLLLFHGSPAGAKEPGGKALEMVSPSDCSDGGEGETTTLIEAYREYQAGFAAIETVEDIEENGYDIVEGQSFPTVLESFGEEEVTFVPIMDRKYHRLALLIVDAEGTVLFKTDLLETNNRCPGQLTQPTRDIAAVSFQDLNLDGLTDIILITDCENDTGAYAGKPYKTGDVLFQRDQSFYRDWRISDKINRFSMNKSAHFIMAYVRDGSSTEILYTATTLDELLDNGFEIIQENSYYYNFEKQGRLRVVPGVIHMAEYDVLMIYLVNEQGYIVWSFQPMGDYDNLYALRGITCRDLDGDGMKDVVILGSYSRVGPEEELLVETKCDIYYQRTDGFSADTDFRDYYQVTEEDTAAGLVDIVREYWGWGT